MKEVQKLNYTTKFQKSLKNFKERYHCLYGSSMKEMVDGFLSETTFLNQSSIVNVLEEVDHIDDCCELLKLKYPNDVEALRNCFNEMEGYFDEEEYEKDNQDYIDTYIEKDSPDLDYIIMKDVFSVAVFEGYRKLQDKCLVQNFFESFYKDNKNNEQKIFNFFSEQEISKSYLQALVLDGDIEENDFNSIENFEVSNIHEAKSFYN